MRELKQFIATGVFGYLNIDLCFNQDLTFLYGLNGSGKTTALKLMMALLEPSLPPLLATPFDSAVIHGEDHEFGSVTVKAEKSRDTLTLRCSVVDNDPFTLSMANITAEEALEAFAVEFKQHPVYESLTKISSPIFLGIDRRLRVPVNRERFRPARSARQLAIEYERERSSQDPMFDPGLSEVAFIVEDFIRTMRRRQLFADDKFRKTILLDAFSYIAPEHGLSFEPDEQAFRDLASKREAIVQAFARLDLEEEVERKSTEFFHKLEELASRARELMRQPMLKERRDDELSKALMTWFVNQPQLERIDRLFKAATTYQEDLGKITRPLDGFLEITNKFFAQTGKTVLLRAGEIQIEMAGKRRSLGALSSGERQILIMLAHLSLNQRLKRDGVFVVDEPELSLHMAWQDMFVDAIQTANPKLQLILATHSPAIIGGRDNLCVPVASE
jgi:predicted ATPase